MEGRHRMAGPRRVGEGCPARRRRPHPSHLTTLPTSGRFRFMYPPPMTKVVTRSVTKVVTRDLVTSRDLVTMVRERSRFTEQEVNTPKRGGQGAGGGGASARCSRRGARGGGVARCLKTGPHQDRMGPLMVLTSPPRDAV